MTVVKSKFGHSVDLATIHTKDGQTAQVASQVAPNFQGFINDLEATGYKIGSLGGFSDRANVNNSSKPSQHAYGLSIDINPTTNANRQSGTDMPVAQVQQLIKKWGLGWGLNWNSVKDPMHFSAAKNEGGFIDPKTMSGSFATPAVTANNTTPAQTATTNTDMFKPYDVATPQTTDPATALLTPTGVTPAKTDTENGLFSAISDMGIVGNLESVYAEAAKAIASAKDSIDSQPMVQSDNPLRAELSSIFDKLEV